MKSRLDILNFVGSVCSIAALLIVVFADMDWLKGFFIIVSLVFAFSLVAAIATFIIGVAKRCQAFENPFIRICSVIFGSILAVTLAALTFWGCYILLGEVSFFISSLIDAVKSYDPS